MLLSPAERQEKIVNFCFLLWKFSSFRSLTTTCIRAVSLRHCIPENGKRKQASTEMSFYDSCCYSVLHEKKIILLNFSKAIFRINVTFFFRMHGTWWYLVELFICIVYIHEPNILELKLNNPFCHFHRKRDSLRLWKLADAFGFVFENLFSLWDIFREWYLLYSRIVRIFLG